MIWLSTSHASVAQQEAVRAAPQASDLALPGREPGLASADFLTGGFTGDRFGPADLLLSGFIGAGFIDTGLIVDGLPLPPPATGAAGEKRAPAERSGFGQSLRRLLLPFLVLCLLPFGLMAFGNAAHADQRDSRLPDLFKQLQQAKSPGEALIIESAIWEIWAESGSKELDRLMTEGTAAMAIRDYATAMSDFDEVTNRAPQFAEGWNKRATLLYLLGDLQASLEDIGRVLKLEPRHFGALAGLGLVNLGLDHEEAARDAFREVLKIDPMNPAAKANLKAVQQQIDNKSI